MSRERIGLQAVFFAIIAVAASILFVWEHQRIRDAEIGKQFPYTASLDGQVLISEDGRPMRFHTREDADRYARDYAKP